MVSSESLIADGTHLTEVIRNARSRSLSAENVNNSNDVRKFFKVDGYDVTGFYQLLVKSMHKKVLKGTKWMPRRILPMKDVEDCDKSRGAVNKL